MQRTLPFAIAALPLATWADTSTANAPGLSAGMVLQTVLSLLFILGLFFLATYLLRKTGAGRGLGSNGPLRIVGSLMIGTRERIVLVEVGDTWLVVGVGPSQIRTLHTLAKGELPDSTMNAQPFGQWLKQMIERKNAAQ